MNASEFIARARSLLDRRDESGRLKPVTYSHDVRYFHPDSDEPPAAGLDCGTFVRWAAKLNVNDPTQAGSNRRWDTTGIASDAIGAGRFFQKIAAPYPGCVIVYPDYKAEYEVTGWPATDPNSSHDGHIAIVTKTGVVTIPTRTGPKTFFGATRVIHCSRLIEGMYGEFVPEAEGHSIAETSALAFYAFAPIYASIRNIQAEPFQAADRD